MLDLCKLLGSTLGFPNFQRDITFLKCYITFLKCYITFLKCDVTFFVVRYNVFAMKSLTFKVTYCFCES